MQRGNSSLCSSFWAKTSIVCCPKTCKLLVSSPLGSNWVISSTLQVPSFQRDHGPQRCPWLDAQIPLEQCPLINTCPFYRFCFSRKDWLMPILILTVISQTSWSLAQSRLTEGCIHLKEFTTCPTQNPHLAHSAPHDAVNNNKKKKLVKTNTTQTTTDDKWEKKKAGFKNVFWFQKSQGGPSPA